MKLFKKVFVGIFLFVFLGWLFPVYFFAPFTSKEDGTDYIDLSDDDEALQWVCVCMVGLCWWFATIYLWRAYA